MMKILKRFINGVLLILILLTPTGTRADVCNPNEIDSQYKRIYCGMKLYENEEADEKLIEVLATQFKYDEEIVRAILSNQICPLLKEMAQSDKEALEDVPEPIRVTCLSKTVGATEKLAGWDIFAEVKQAYEREKLIHQQSSRLEFKFKASEQYWDGELAGAPFDLIVDLNLIEIVLFGSRAEWYNDVFFFPVEDDEKKDDLPPLLPGQFPDEAKDEKEGTEEESGKDGEEEGAVLAEDCVPPDHPDAQSDLFAEGGSGQDLMCMDPEAVYFKQPGSDNASASEDSGCPAGTVPKKKSTEDERQRPSDVGQPLAYPGPYIGGTLKKYPASNRPLCGPGTSPVMITIAGKEHIAEDDDGNPICLPTEFCADFDAARDYIFGDDWEDDDALVNIAPAIEALFCVNVTTHNRPPTPYARNEGCIDCHIRAMVDALEETLAGNVTPLANSTSAFAISSRWGPNYSFNLSTAFKGKVRFKESNLAQTAVSRTERSLKEAEENAINPEFTIPKSGAPLETIRKDQEELQEEEAKIKEAYKDYVLTSGTISDQEVGGRVKTLLAQMNNSFIHIQDKWSGLATSLSFDDKKECP